MHAKKTVAKMARRPNVWRLSHWTHAWNAV